jgi:hypothetical protein
MLPTTNTKGYLNAFFRVCIVYLAKIHYRLAESALFMPSLQIFPQLRNSPHEVPNVFRQPPAVYPSLFHTRCLAAFPIRGGMRNS